MGLTDVGEHYRVNARNGPGIGPALAVEVQDSLAGVVCRERRDAQLRRERIDPVLRWSGPLAAHLDDAALAVLLVDDAAAHAVAGLEQQYRPPGGDEFTGGDKAGEASTHHQDVRGFGHCYLQLRR